MASTQRRGGRKISFGKIEQPVGAAIFSVGSAKRPARRWVEALYNVVDWKRHDSGGHFAALEEPAALVDDIRSLFRKVR